MNAEKRLNVRCCCQPQKILGTLPAPISGEAEAKTFSLNPIRDENGNVSAGSMTLEIATFCEYTHAKPKDEFIEDASYMKAFLDIFGPKKEKAYKAEGRTVEELRRIPEFVEAK